MAIRFSTFPRTQPPPHFVSKVIERFEQNEPKIGTVDPTMKLTSNKLLAVIRHDLIELGFEVEGGARAQDKINRPVFFGENAEPDLEYQIDAWHPEWFVGLEIEAGRACMGNAIYRDLVQALVMVDMKHLILAVPQFYRYKRKSGPTSSQDYKKTVSVAQALYAHSRVEIPFSLCVIGY